MSEEIGKRMGDYEVLSVLGAGGMGQVFKVRNVLSDRIEAMKVLLPDLAGHQDVADRFLREIKVLAALNHPNIAGLRTALTLGNQLVMIMEYVEGSTLAQILTKGPIAVREAVNYADQVLSALSYAHQQNVIHRDIKPANMMLTPQGVVKLMDFGIARYGNDQSLTMTGTTLGSLYYMSPEQVKGEPTDARSDLYSLGVSMYEMVIGERPFRGGNSDYSLMMAHVQEQPTPPIALRPDLPPGLNEFIMTAMAKDPRQRFQSADASRRALSSVGAAIPPTHAAQAMPSPLSAPLSATSVFQSSPGVGSIEAPHSQPNSGKSPGQQEEIPVANMAANEKFRRSLYMAMGGLAVVAVLVAAAFFPRATKAVTLVSISIAPDSFSASTGTSANFMATGTYNDGTKKDVTLQSTWTSSNPDIATVVSPSQNPELVNCLSAGSGSISAAMGSISATAAATCVAPPAPTPLPLPAEGGGSVANDNGGGQGQGHKSGRIDNHYVHAKKESEPSVQPPVASPSDRGQLRKLEGELDQLSSRANSINDSLDNLRRQQSAEGLSLRGDMASAQEMMKTYLAKAQSAFEAQDLDNATRYLTQADAQATKLERFLGR